MAASRLSFFRSSFSHFYRIPASNKLPFHLLSHFRLVASPSVFRLAAVTLHSHAPRSFSAATDSTAVTPPELVSSHPWPEWVSFIDKLKDKGYFADDSSSGEDVLDKGANGLSDLNRLKTACMKFARERFDIIRSLSIEDIKAVVESGCPNLLRKAVNSSKRLRSYVKLDEGEVCSACNLRGSCDRAYLIIKADEVARTVDVMRILISYAMEPRTSSSAEKSDGRKQVEASVRKLLSVLTELCDSVIDPSLQKPVLKSFDKKEKVDISTVSENKLQNEEMKRGEWICSTCNFLNFSRNIRCLKCKEDGPKKVSFSDVQLKEGDWICPECNFMNFARNAKCLRCRESRPKRQLQVGEWECPSCNYLNFRRNITCLKCSCERPKGDVDQYEDQTWRKPRLYSEDKKDVY